MLMTGLAIWSYGDETASKGSPTVIASNKSILVNGLELRTAKSGYISLAAARRALGPATNQYSWGAPIYVWHPVGIALQTGWRGDEKGKIFKFQVYFEDYYDGRTEMKSGAYPGLLRLDGVAITPETKFASIRAELKSKGFQETDGQVTYAKKGGIEIFQSEATGRIARVDIWCP